MELGIKSILEAYRARLRAPQGVVVDEVVKAYTEVGVRCTSSDFSYTPSTKIVTITAGGPHKMELRMRKDHVLQSVGRRLRADDVPQDIL
jgi:hypothetical protein